VQGDQPRWTAICNVNTPPPVTNVGVPSQGDIIPLEQPSTPVGGRTDPRLGAEVEHRRLTADAGSTLTSTSTFEVTVEVEYIEFELGGQRRVPAPWAGQVQAKEIKEVFGERREYLTIKILPTT